MSGATKANADTADLEQQLRALRSDVAGLADLLKNFSSQKAADAGKAINEQADEIIARGREIAGQASERAKGAVTSIEEHIAEKPVQSAIMALLIGIVVGSMGRR
jgi:ElaB/YqjD/DUF883 family membrane-anchored ribosome-binding protein